MNDGTRLLLIAAAAVIVLSTARAQVENREEELVSPVDDETVKYLLLQRGWRLNRGPQGDWILRREKLVPATQQPQARALPQSRTGDAGQPADFETVKQLLLQRGWQLDRTPQGDWVLRRGATPPVVAPSPTQKAPQSDATNRWQSADYATMKNLLSQRGWRLDRTPHGDWILRRGTAPTVTPPPPGRTPEVSEPDPVWQPASIEQLRELLVPHGWRVEQEADGSVLLFPAANTVAPVRPVSPAASPQIADSPSPASSQSRAPEADDGDQLRDLLRAHGLHIERDPQGGVIIYPIARPEPKSVPKPSQPAVTTGAQPPVQPSVEPVLEIIQQHGWGVDREADGSLILTPPVEKPVAATQEETPPTAAVTEDEHCSGVLLSTLFLENGDLPVNSELEATTAAKGWIEHRTLDGVTAGRVRRVLRVYLVSIVDEKQPHVLRNQLSIRRVDGCMTPLL